MDLRQHNGWSRRLAGAAALLAAGGALLTALWPGGLGDPGAAPAPRASRATSRNDPTRSVPRRSPQKNATTTVGRPHQGLNTVTHTAPTAAPTAATDPDVPRNGITRPA
ncbi:hypothetical protein [Streptomyces litchfieldiae]|uniref:Uncharacterized protein n=1 Tax=Streptomyces litchfieldiae TaxID=3075543 RepID=A0ABU2MJR8_9ACTN|nr:hypothetical protein [Streptomyces sp. DSM 44938]MDT0341837.1 hypothetical protein [Streptomyces sp. DSM 44938]